MIDEATESVVVTTYGSEAERARVQATVARLRRGAPNARSLLRRLQPYVVSLYRHEAERYRRGGLLVEVIDGLNEWQGRYDDTRGIVADQVRLDELVV
jgi:hypothetical protein